MCNVDRREDEGTTPIWLALFSILRRKVRNKLHFGIHHLDDGAPLCNLRLDGEFVGCADAQDDLLAASLQGYARAIGGVAHELVVIDVKLRLTCAVQSYLPVNSAPEVKKPPSARYGT